MTTMTTSVLTAEALLDHWQGHRRVTRKTIEAFPEDKLFSYSLGSMRPFSVMVAEMLKMAVPITKGVATGKWEQFDMEATGPATKAELLKKWDEDSAALTALWPTIPAHRYEEQDVAFGMWPGSGISMLLYAIDNETHHRAQGYVYLRALGIEPPAFYDRA
jgi:uncharacterized damage-inducible protein DinB